MTRFSSLLLCALSASVVLPLQAAHARPAQNGTASTEIDFSSLDLNSREGWLKANYKIIQASHAVCQKLLNENWLIWNDVSDCEQDALSDARTSLYDLRDRQKSHRQSGHVFLALSARK